MDTVNIKEFLHRLTRNMAAQTLADHSDRQLVERALAGPDETAFQAIVNRHGPMVYRVCWRVLQHSQDAEDAFQATFLVLAQKLRALRDHHSLASWLHGIAHRVALRARAQAAAQRRRDHEASRPDRLLPEDVTWGELRSALDGELGRLPEHWRLPLILCYLEGRTQDEAAEQLGWSKSKLRRYLDKGREVLGRRLAGRGIAVPAALAAVLLSDCFASASPTTGSVAATVEAAAGVLGGKSVAQIVNVKVATLTEGMVRAMFVAKVKTVMAAVILLGVVTLGGFVTQHMALGHAHDAALAAQEKEGPQEFGKKTDPAQASKADPTRRDTDRIRAGDRLYLHAANTLPEHPIKGVYLVEPSGKLALGPQYGRVEVHGLTVEEAEVRVKDKLATILRQPQVSLTWYDPVAHKDEKVASDKAPKEDRLQLVRQMYAKLPCDILGFAEPTKRIRMAQKTGMGAELVLEDANGKQLRIHMLTKVGQTSNAILLPVGLLPSRGPEESAVYGLLIRLAAKPSEKTGALERELLEVILNTLDQRFAGATPMASSGSGGGNPANPAHRP